MKKITILLYLLVLSSLSAQTDEVIITTVVDGTCSHGRPKVIELYVRGTHDFTGDTLQIQTNDTQNDWNVSTDISALGSVTDTYVYLINDGTDDNFLTEFPSASGYPSFEAYTVAFNGNDRIRIIDENGAVLDIFGEENVNGSGTAWEYTDSWARRHSGVGPNTAFDINEWDFGGPDALEGKCSADDTTPLENDMGGIQTYLGVTGQSIEGLQVYPNPVMSGEYVRIQSGETIDNVQVFDLLGNLVRESNVTDGLLDTPTA